MSLAKSTSVSVFTNPAQLAAVATPWRSLWQRCPNTTPFQSPDWLIPWWEIFAPGDLRLLTVHRGDDLVGLAPLYRDGSRLLPVGISLSDYHDILADPSDTEVIVKAIAGEIANMDDIDRCEFDELAPGALALTLTLPRWNTAVEPSSPCPILSLPEYLRKLPDCISPSRLRHLRTARRRVARRGDSAIIEGDADNAVALFTDLVRLHGLRWQMDGKMGVFADSRVSAFHVAALPGLIEQGIARLYALTIGDAVVGVYYGLRHRERAYAYIGGYDPDFAFESPGAVLLGHAIEEAVREGATSFDFLRGDEAYKYEWGAQDRWNNRLTLSRRQKSRAYA